MGEATGSDLPAGALLPVPVTHRGQFEAYSQWTWELAQREPPEVVLAALEAFLALTRVAGDEKTFCLLSQRKMHIAFEMGRFTQARQMGEELLRRREATGFVLGQAKTLADLAELHMRLGEFAEGIRCLARCGLLLDTSPQRDSWYGSALASVADAAETAELYEVADDAHCRAIELVRRQPTEMGAFDGARRGETLLHWGLRLDQLGRHDEARRRIGLAASLLRRYLTEYRGPASSPFLYAYQAAYALALAKLGEAGEALRIAREVVVPLRDADDSGYALMAHLALGVASRAQGDLAGAYREMVAATQMCRFGARADDRLVVGSELARLSAEVNGDRASRDFLAVLAEQARMLWDVRLQRLAMLRQARQREELELRQAIAERDMMHDPLTGLGNRRRFDQLMAQVSVGGLPPPVTLLVIDVDNFKYVNDTYSHSEGDRALREIAAILSSHCRGGDIAVRYAGDEFTVFLQAGYDQARLVAERMRAAVVAATIIEGTRISISTGVATLRPGMTGPDLFRAADRRLYDAKHQGRNQVAA